MTTGTFDPEAFIAQARWVLARTQDHEYTTRAQNDPDAFEAMVRYIREAPASYSERYGTTRAYYRYLNIGPELRYWTMGWPVNATVVINRARRPE